MDFNNILLYGGGAVGALGAVGFITVIILFFILKKRLKQALEEDYGRKMN